MEYIKYIFRKRIGKYFTPIDPMWVFIGAWVALMITILKVSGQI